MTTKKVAPNKKCPESALIIKDNALITAAYTLDLVEQRLILLAMALASKSRTPITPDTEITITAQDYASQFHVSVNTAYDALRVAEKQLYNRTLKFQRLSEKGNVEVVQRRWITGFSYINQEATVRIKFEGDVIRLFSMLEAQFTTYRINQISRLTSVYAIRLYEILISWRRLMHTPEIALTDLRAQLGVQPTEYKRMDHFKVRVLDMAISQICELTDIYKIKYEQHRTGRRISGFSFTFSCRATAIEPSASGINSGDSSSPDHKQDDAIPIKMSDKQRKHFAMLICKLEGFGSFFAGTGMGMAEFVDWTANELKNPERRMQWASELESVGFIPNREKASK